MISKTQPPVEVVGTIGLRTSRRQKRRQLLRSPEFVVGAVIVVFWILCALIGPLVVPYDPFSTNPPENLLGPSSAHWFGTDRLGRDVFSRVIVGSRDILVVGLLAAIFATTLGTVIGLAMGFFGGVVDEVLSRISEAVMALPNVIVALLVLTALGPSPQTLILVVGGGFGWVIARTVRSAVLTERNEDYIDAALVRGERTGYVLFGEILPNIVPVIVVEFTVRIALAIFSIASLSFLGFGVQPPSPDWGLQIAESYVFLAAGYWWMAFFPAVAIATLVVGVYLTAEALHEVLET